MPGGYRSDIDRFNGYGTAKGNDWQITFDQIVSKICTLVNDVTPTFQK